MKSIKGMKKLSAVLVAILVLGTASVAFAATYKTPAEITAGITGKTVEDLNKEKAAGKSYGTIASEAGKLDEFKTQMLEQKKAVLDQRVKDGKLTQAQADEIYNLIKTNQATCDGTGNAAIGKKYGVGFGNGAGKGMGMGKGMGRGMGCGAGIANSSCTGACSNVTTK